MKVVLGQINPKIGDIFGNTATVLKALRDAIARGADLVVFPELCITGYPPRDLLEFPSLIEAGLKSLSEIAAQVPDKVHVLIGYVDKNTGASGKPFHNAAALLSAGKIQGKYFKRLLPYYDVFEDERYFESGTEPVIWTVKGKRVGVTICEDAWNEPGFVARRYKTDPVQETADKKCDLLVNLSASPFYVGKPALRLELFKKAALKCNAPVVFCNQVGGADDLIFDGSSFVLGSKGEVLAQERPFVSSLLENRFSIVSSYCFCSPPFRKPTGFREALQMGVRDYCAKSGVGKVILGLSGGVDSSVMACLAVGALGAKSVTGVSLPSRYTSEASRQDAREIAERLGISFHEVPMDAAYESYRKMLAPFLADARDTLMDENLQPRIRMTILMALSQKFGALLLNTSNKSEVSSGYATLYGDTAGALAPLADLTKRRVYDLAHYFQFPNGPIPERVVSRAPTAELRPDQKDEDSLPPYSLLDDLVTHSVEQGMDRVALTAKHPGDKALVDRFGALYAGSEFKRFQSPPILRVTRRSFGRGRRIPLAALRPF